MVSSRDEILGKIRKALGDSRGTTVEIPRNFLSHAPGIDPKDTDSVANLLDQRLQDYGAITYRINKGDIAKTVAEALSKTETLVVPTGIPDEWVSDFAGNIYQDEPKQLTHEELNSIQAIITTCTVAVAESGTIMLNTDAGQGRRAPTLLPDLQVCVIFDNQVVSSMPEAINRVDPKKPVTCISGPSATADIEMIRVQGVHGPRHLTVILVRDRN